MPFGKRDHDEILHTGAIIKVCAFLTGRPRYDCPKSVYPRYADRGRWAYDFDDGTKNANVVKFVGIGDLDCGS